MKPVTPEMLNEAAAMTEAMTKAALLDDEMVDPGQVLAGIDAILDQAQALVVDVDREALPPEVTQALDMLFGVGPTVDELLEAMGVYDPDDNETSSGDAGEVEDSAEKSAADADDKSAAAAEDSAEAAALRARSLAFLCKKTSEL